MSTDAASLSSQLGPLEAAVRIATSGDLGGIASALLEGARGRGVDVLGVEITRAEVVLARAGAMELPVALAIEREVGSPPVRVALRMASEGPDEALVIERLVELAAAVARRMIEARESERLAADRRDLLAIVSHDLRTPLQSLGLGLDAVQMQIEGTPVAPNVAGTLARMRRAVSSAGQLLGDLLDVSRIQNGALSVQMRSSDLAKIFAELAEQHGPILAARGLALEVQAPEVPETICDAPRLSQALSNLLSNAAKHATRGPVVLRAVGTSDRVRIEVADAGPGISSEVRDRLFDRLYQAAPAPGRRGGLGLGLFIAKGIAAAHGGDVGVVGEPGAGSTFFVELPRRPASR